MDGEVRIPIFLDVDESNFEKKLTNLNPKLDKLRASLKDIANTRLKSENWDPVDVVKLKTAITELDKIKQRVLAIGEINMSDNDWDKAFDSYQENIETLDTIIGKYQTLKFAMLDIPKDWANITNAKELAQYIDALNGRLKQTRDMLENGRKGDTVLDATEAKISTNIEELEKLIAKIGEYQQKLSDAESNAAARTKEITAMRKDGDYSKEAIEAQKQVAKAARESYAELQKDSGEATNALKQDIRERIAALKEEEAAYAERIQELKNTPVSPEDSRRPSNKYRQEDTEAIEEATEAENKHTDAVDRGTESNKKSAASFYYKLRAVKMLGFVFNSTQSALDKFGRTSLDVARKSAKAYASLLPGVALLRLHTLRAANSQGKLASAMKLSRKETRSNTKELKSSAKAHENFNFSLKKVIKSILAYGLGIRSLYMLMRKLRSAIKDGLGEMSQQFDDVNAKMSSILTSINYMKASLVTIVEPLLTMVAPALEKISELVSNISYHVASFIAALSGQQNVYRAVKVQADYADSLDKTAKNAKKAKKELAGFDELNVLHSNDEDEQDFTMGWELVPALQESLDLVEKLKGLLDDLFGPIKAAWENMKDFVINSWKYAVERLKSLAGTIWDDFLRVWKDPKTQKIFEDIFKIIGDIGLIVGNLAKAFEDAWKHNDNGYRILSAIRDVIGIIVAGIRECADATVKWSEKIDFKPLLDAVADVLEKQIVPAVQKIVDLFVYLYENAVLPFATYLIETLAPILVQIVGNIAEIFGTIAQKIKEGLEHSNNLQRILGAIESIISSIAGAVLRCTERTKEWAKELTLTPLIDAITNALSNQVAPAVDKIVRLFEYLYDTVLLELARFFVENLGPKLAEIFGDVSETIGNIAEKIRLALEEGDRGQRIISGIESIVSIVADGIGECAKKTKEWSENVNFNTLFEAVATVLNNQVVPAVSKIKDLFVSIYENAILPMATYVIETLGPKFVEIFGNVSETVGNIAENIKKAFEENDKGSQILQKIQDIVGYIADKLVDVSEKTKEWAKQLDFSKLTDATLQFLEKAEPMIQWIVDTVGKFWTDVLLPFWSYMTETGGPKLLEILGGIAEKMDWDNITESTNTFFEAFEQFLELGWDTLLQILQDIGDKIADFVNSGHLKTIVDWFKNWVTDADPEELAGKIEKFVKVFADLYAGFTVMSKIIMPIITGFLTLGNAFIQIFPHVSNLVTAIGTGSGGTGLAGAIGGLAVPIGIVIGVVATMVASFGGVKNTIDELKERFDRVKESVTQFAESIKLSESIDKLKEAFGRLSVDLEKLRPLFEFLLDVLAEIASEIINTALGAIDGLVIAFTGIIDVVKGVTDWIDGLLKLLSGDFKGGLDGMSTGMREVFGGLYEFFGGLFIGIAEALNEFVFHNLPDAKKGVQDFINGVKDAFEWLKNVLIGDPIVYDIRDGVIEGFGEFVEKTWGSIKEWAGNIKDKFAEMKEGLGEKVVATKDAVVDGFTKLKEGLLGQSKEATTQTENDFTTMDSNIKSDINSTSLTTSGTEYIQGLQTGVDTQYPILNEDLQSKLAEISQSFLNMFNTQTLYLPGMELITGLQTGISEQWLIFSEFITLTLTYFTEQFNLIFNIETLYLPGMSFIQGLQTGISEQWIIFNESLTLMLAELVSAFTNVLNLETLYQTGIDLLQGFENGINEKSPSVIETITTFVNTVIDSVKTILGIGDSNGRNVVDLKSSVFTQLGSCIMTSFEEGILDKSPNVIKTLEGVYNSILDKTKSFEKSFISRLNTHIKNVTKILKDYKSSVTKIFNSIITKFGEMIVSVQKKFDELRKICVDEITLLLNLFNDTLNNETLFSSGQSLIQGLIDGIVSQHDNLMSTIEQEVKNVKNKFIGDAVNLVTTAVKSASSMSNFTNLANRYLYDDNVEDALEATMDKYQKKWDEIVKKYSKKSGDTSIRMQLGNGFSVAAVLENEQDKASLKKELEELYDKYKKAAKETANKHLRSDKEMDKLAESFSKTRSTSYTSAITDTAGEGLNINTLYATGANLIIGLMNGMKSKESDLMEYVEDLCDSIKKKIQSALKINSPSKFTYEVGRFLMLGMENGIEDNKDAVTDTFSDIELTPDMKFESTFLNGLSTMKDNALTIVSEMADSMETIMDNINFITSIETMQMQLDKIGDIKIPNIVAGKVLPSTSEFTNKRSNEPDTKQIADAVKSAMIEAMSSMRYNNTEQGDIVIKLDSYELFRATRNQNDIFRNSTGYSAF